MREEKIEDLGEKWEKMMNKIPKKEIIFYFRQLKNKIRWLENKNETLNKRHNEVVDILRVVFQCPECGGMIGDCRHICKECGETGLECTCTKEEIQ